MKTGIQILLWILCGVFAYLIYQSITGPIRFQKVKEQRFSQVISSLKDIQRSQEAHKSVKGVYAKNFTSLVKFVDTERYIITSQKDSSFLRYNDAFGIDMPVDTVVIKVLDSISVRDSLFKKDTRYKNMMNVPGALKGEKFTMAADVINKGGYDAPVYEVKVEKKAVLGDQPADLLSRENAQIGVDEVNGNVISVGSLVQVSTSGNWPPIYDRKRAQ